MANDLTLKIEEAKSLGIELTGKETEKDLDKLIKKAKKEASESASEEVLVWIKQKTYVSDTHRVNAGLYSLEKVPERLRKLSSAEVEIFEDGVDRATLSAIARWCGVNPDAVEEVGELLKDLVSEYAPYEN